MKKLFTIGAVMLSTMTAFSQASYTVHVTKLMAKADDCDGGGLCWSNPQDPVMHIWVTDGAGTESEYCFVFDGDDNMAYDNWNDIDDLLLASETNVNTTYLSFDMEGWESDAVSTSCSVASGDDEHYERQFASFVNLESIEPGTEYIDTVSLIGIYNMEIKVVWEDLDASVENLDAFPLIVYPNPTEGNLIIATEEEIESIEIIDLTGTTIRTENQKQFSIADLPVGAYFVRVNSDKGSVVKRVLKK